MNNKFFIELIDINEYKEVIEKYEINLPIYMEADALKFYKKLEIIRVCKGTEIVAMYAYPIFLTGEEVWVKREYRFLPYSSPVFLKDFSTIEKKKICYSIFKYIFNKYDVVYIPLSTNFDYISSIQSLGGFVEERGTNVIKNKIELNRLNGKLRNHISHAKRYVNISITQNTNEFKYENAIKGNDEEKNKRQELAKYLIKQKKGIIINAYEGENNIAGAVVIYDRENAYLLHTWQNIDTIRGTIPLIIVNAINWCFETLSIKNFDFEGSVINSIDDFFASFDTKIDVYPYIHFAKEKNNFFSIIERSINISGRKKENEEP